MATVSMTRRWLLVRFGGTVAVAQLLDACSGATTAPATAPTGAAPKPTTGPATTPAAAVVSKSGRASLPTYVPPKAPPPDIPGGGPVPPGYTTYPKQILRSVADTPARGGDITIVTQTLGVVPPGPDSNPIWQELNKRVGANLNITIIPFADYGATKLPTILAGADLPDLLFLPRGQRVPGTAQFLDSKCADLTPFVGGDAIKDYPNLAALPTGIWRTTVYNNKIYGVPDALAPFFWVHWHHQELLQQAGLQPPKNGAEYKNLMQTLAKPNDGLYGLVAEVGFQYGYGVTNQLFTSMFGGPNQWRLGSDGKLTRLFETDEFRQAVEYAAGLWSAGLYEPGAPGYNTLSARQAFIARKGVFRWDGNTADIYHSVGVGAGGQSGGAGLQPPPAIRLLAPFPAQDGGKPTYPLYHGSFGMTVLKKTSDDRVKELLRVLNLLASPFGTEERELISSGIEGRDFTRNDAGAPVVNDNPGRVETMLTTVQNIVNPPPVYFDPLGADYTQHVVDTFKQYATFGVEDPTIGFYSETDTRQGLIADQRLGDGVTDIIAGRRPPGDLAQLISDWRGNGGEQVRKEYQDAMAAAA